ncbi:MAG TPA: CHASE3 domain-containing protein [Jatrophihabitantaceae bacterium]|nr:CHASE3 domain-containing protein [Jatrophihabitantaceae bacterium]
MSTRLISPRNRIRTFRFWATVAVLLLAAATLTSAIIGKVEHDAIATSQNDVRLTLRPARTAEADLLTAYVNQETGQRGFLLTGDASFLVPYVQGDRDARQLEQQLRGLFASDPTSNTRLDAIVAAGNTWRADAADPQIAVRRQSAVMNAQFVALVDKGKLLFDALRTRFDALTSRTESQISAALANVSIAQADAGTAINATLIGAFLVAVLALAGLRYLFAKPLGRFLRQIQTIARGDYRGPIDARGPREFKVVADAVDRMRDNIVRTTIDAAAAQQRLGVREERDRLAADLHDRTIQRVFGLGLSLDALNNANPTGELEPMIEETDRIIRELRSVIFAISADHEDEGLRAGIVDLVTDSRRSLGFMPHLDLRGPLDSAVPEPIAAEVLAVLREALSNIARHARATTARVSVAYDSKAIRLEVSDDGTGLAPDARAGDGTRNIRARASKFDGTTTITTSPSGGTVVTWQVPLPVQ